MINIPNEPIFKPSEVARLFRVSARTILRWIEVGEIKGAIRIGKKSILIPRESVVQCQHLVEDEDLDAVLE